MWLRHHYQAYAQTKFLSVGHKVPEGFIVLLPAVFGGQTLQ